MRVSYCVRQNTGIASTERKANTFHAMNIVQLTPGAGDMFCGNCFHDNALVAALRQLGHDATMLPLYLPVRVDGENESADQPIFFGGVNVYLEQKSAFYRNAPGAIRWFAPKIVHFPQPVGVVTLEEHMTLVKNGPFSNRLLPALMHVPRVVTNTLFPESQNSWTRRTLR